VRDAHAALLLWLEVAHVFGACPARIHFRLDAIKPEAVLGKPLEVAYKSPHLRDGSLKFDTDPIAQRAWRERGRDWNAHARSRAWCRHAITAKKNTNGY
jgi:hypothetical protein